MAKQKTPVERVTAAIKRLRSDIARTETLIKNGREAADRFDDADIRTRLRRSLAAFSVILRKMRLSLQDYLKLLSDEETKRG